MLTTTTFPLFGSGGALVEKVDRVAVRVEERRALAARHLDLALPVKFRMRLTEGIHAVDGVETTCPPSRRGIRWHIEHQFDLGTRELERDGGLTLPPGLVEAEDVGRLRLARLDRIDDFRRDHPWFDDATPRVTPG